MVNKTSEYDQDIIDFNHMISEENYCYTSPLMLIKLLNTNKYGQEAICGIITLLNDNTIDHKAIVEDLKCKYNIKCSQNKLAKLIGMDSGNLSKGLKELEYKNLVYRENGIIYLNPLLINNKLINKRTLQKFGIPYKDTTSNDQTKESYTTSTITDNDSKITIYNITINMNKE